MRGAQRVAAALKDKGVPVPEIANKLTIKAGKNAGRHSPVASLYRIRRPEDPLTAEEIDLRERLQYQPHPNAESRS
ncbi:hypothetical protein PUR34_14265 [Streptomyces sp. JV185]|uniref:hypothetical protein n=1 Tax=Streptomyces sp. JV185 TaxID=858638 RepID=UPI002E77996D|nr:hypothetical protein [Streptomyces sp. JV185]MEE1769283.1 hypothetical protein [Streptomyces sp. JV185]